MSPACEYKLKQIMFAGIYKIQLFSSLCLTFIKGIIYDYVFLYETHP